MEENVDVSEDVRLKYRYVDLRRPHMQRNIILRSKIAFAVRQFLDSTGFPRNRNAVHDASRRRKARAITWCRAACSRACSTRCRSRRRSSSSC